jgi:hypothetical protein
VWNAQAAGDDEGLEEFCSAENAYAQRLAGGLGTLQQLSAVLAFCCARDGGCVDKVGTGVWRGYHPLFFCSKM